MRTERSRLDGATVVLTGVSRGIGRALCKLLIAEGATVAAVARDATALAGLRDALGDRVVPFACDLSKVAARDELIDAVTGRFGSIDGLINNAAVQTEMSFTSGNVGDIAQKSAQEIEINLTAPVHLVSRFLPIMSGRAAPFIVNLTSGLAIAPKEAAPVYSGTKAGLRSFTKALRYQAQSSCPELCVTEVIMALVDTDMTRGRGRGKISAERAAAEIVEAIVAGKHEVWVAKAKMLPILARVSPGIPERLLR
ncbi:SDR family NAD(P)-dependent oxidoreductase [Thalassovita aquimarina]|uniref:SDR family NAD(P)-dependent oxidoreductase n=2 Tax=Thalassovita aquimarina TaxID=2785917 RepID=A0ABS5HR35_9RHOB|nr:SDR family NAD(P)-dependent oxidoreductase [Thalassovita aquimarina]MBR9651383.1 SDR family NAD(P)-dependent oxidoreductase [Thalassovita aquimarina]